jgi:hypothetical protein
MECVFLMLMTRNDEWTVQKVSNLLYRMTSCTRRPTVPENDYSEEVRGQTGKKPDVFLPFVFPTILTWRRFDLFFSSLLINYRLIVC